MKPSHRKTAAALFATVVVLATAAAAQTLSTLASFNGFDGNNPYTSPLVQGTDGNFYGTTEYGGTNCAPNGCGTVFKVTPAGVVTTLYSFCTQEYCADGMYPYAGLIQATDGNFYGTTSQGGAIDEHGGTIFRITPTGTLTTLYSFCLQTNCVDGSYPTGGLVQGADGNLYGTTFTGGVDDAQFCNGGCGTFFKISLKGVFTQLHTFAGYNAEGSAPNTTLVQTKNGNFLGTTTAGGIDNTCPILCNGTVFEITPKGALTTLFSFAASSTEGGGPNGAVVIGYDGNIYGTTVAGGAGSYGTIFKLTPSGTFTTLYSFCVQGNNCPDGGQPESGLVQGTDGNLYGTALRGGLYAVGSIFKITHAGSLTTLYNFCAAGYPACPDGSFPYASLMQSTNGSFYGTTASGGASGDGSLFGFNVGLGSFVTFIRNSAIKGQQFGIIGYGLKGTTAVSLNGTAAAFSVKSDTLIMATVPAGATSGYVSVTTPSGTLKSNVKFNVIP